MDFLEKHKNGVFFLTAVSAGSSVLAMLANYLYNIFMARSIPLDQYGKLSIAIAIITVLSIPSGSFSTFFTREFSKLQSAPEKIAFIANKYSKLLFFAFSILSGGIAVYFVAAGSPEAAMVVLALPAVYAALPLFSMMQAREDIIALSGLNLLGNLIKLAVGIGLVGMGFGLFGASAAIAIPSLLVLFAALFLLRGSLAVTKEPHDVSLRKPVLLMIAIMLLQGLFLYADLFAIQFFFGNEKTGVYNVAETTAKITFFLSGAVIITFFPKAAKLDFSKALEAAKLFFGSAAFLVPSTAVFLIFPSQLIRFFYGEKFAPAVEPFWLLALGFFVFSLFNIVQSALLSKGREKEVLAMNAIGLLVHASLLAFLVPSMGMIGAAVSVAASSAVLLALSVVSLLRFMRHEGNAHSVAS
ncbi:MAG: polysaccharide biosynthesis C-terminal domain-containing protein [Candidatus Micrarchaeia archaeon]|jgi:O-antigen/teichoic acid export membrane protein